jgi:secretion/DNA translocation related TadE-like protein
MRHRDESGAATIWAVWSIVVVLSLGCVAMTVALATARQHRLDAAADLSAVSAAADLARGASPCPTAERVAAANGVALLACTVDGVDVVVSVTDRLRLPLGLVEHLVSRARAGPESPSRS